MRGIRDGPHDFKLQSSDKDGIPLSKLPMSIIAPIEIHRQHCQAFGRNIMSKQIVRRWCRQFSKGRQSVHDEDGSHTARRTAAVLTEFG
ncbi:hypothetical protein TNCV_1589591 [Trichonephila clavipes]|uniref:Mos1 transposase HTH domain-containing protein n=1 Tax=Trichonephila clavipes TaxID=2585209 RepID=A0A8X6V428_TRICX|nr:hypothetical protein TNCV_1589591 [Trichonephila clavipes]